MLLPLISAGLGGLEAYKASRGDLGAALLGAGLGAVTPAGLRMAGTALGGTALGGRLLGAIPQAVSRAGGALGATKVGQAALKAGLIPQGPLPALSAAGLGGLAAGAGLALGVPQLMGSAASAATQPIRAITGGGMNIATGQQMPSGAYPGNAVPPLGQYGPTPILGTSPLDIYSPTGAFQSNLAARKLATEAELRALKTIKPYEAYMSEETKKADLRRQVAYEGIRQNMEVARNLLESGVGTAQQMGLQSGQAISNVLGNIYQYR